MCVQLVYSYVLFYCSHSFDDVICLSECEGLSELTLDGNPLAHAPDHRQSIIFHINHLRALDQTPVTVNKEQPFVYT